MRAIEVRESSQVGEARRTAVSLGELNGFDPVHAGRVGIVATELATNLLKHGSGGTLLVGDYDDETGTGIECLALDRGPGMADVPSAMRDGYSTAGSLGQGLGAITRLTQFSQIYSRPGLGTAVLARLPQTGPKGVRSNQARHGAVAVPIAGETVNGDGWCRAAWEGGWTVMLSDGLGHGPRAEEASQAAARVFQDAARRASPAELLALMHVALRPTRGAAVSIARVDEAAGRVVFGGVGNVAGVLVAADGGLRRMVTNNGTAGHIAKHMKEFSYDINDAVTLVMASDGLTTSWRIDGYPGLLHCHPTLLAGVLYRDFSRGRDDVTVLACRIGGA